MAAILKIFKPHLLMNGKSNWPETWSEALECYGDSELLKWFLSDIQDGRHGARLGILQTSLKPKSDWAETWREASGWHGGSELLKSFSSNIHDGGDGGKLETLQTTSDSELLKTVWSDSQDGNHGTM